MSVVVCGSLAYDNLMEFDGKFGDYILPDQIHILSVAFNVPRLRKEFGGCAGNIGYNLKLLGIEPIITATVGQDTDVPTSVSPDSGPNRTRRRLYLLPTL